MEEEDNPCVNNARKEYFIRDNMCVICFLYHFDLGSYYLIDGIYESREKVPNHKYYFDDIEKKIREVIEDGSIKVHYCDKMTMQTPTYLIKTNPPEYPINKGYLSMDIRLPNEDKPLPEKECKFHSKKFQYDMELIVAHIDLFDTGVATVNLGFKLEFWKKLCAGGIYEAYETIYLKIMEELDDEQIDSVRTNSKTRSGELSILKHIYKIIKKIRDNCKRGQPELYKQGEKWTLSPYPLFCLPKIEKSKLEELPLKDLPLLDLKSEDNSDHKSELAQYVFISEKSLFIPKWNAALLIDNGENTETYVRLLELCSYIWLSAFLFRSYLIKELDKISERKDNIDERISQISNKISERKDNIDERISQISKLRIRSIQIQQIKYQSLLSLWDNSEEIYDNVLEEAWGTDRTLNTKIGEIAEFLDSRYQYLQGEKQNESNSKISNGLSFLQIMSIPLAILFVLLTLDPTSSICTLLKTCNGGWDVYLLLVALVISIIGCLIIYWKKLRLSQ